MKKFMNGTKQKVPDTLTSFTLICVLFVLWQTLSLVFQATLCVIFNMKFYTVYRP
jgi:hypothetical protein